MNAEDEETRPEPRPASEGGPLDSDALFAGREEVVILHRGREYRLRRTRMGKLILTA